VPDLGCSQAAFDLNLVNCASSKGANFGVSPRRSGSASWMVMRS